MDALQPTHETWVDWKTMQETSRGRTLSPVPGRLGKCSAPLDRTRSDNHSVSASALSEAAADFGRLITCLDPQQLTPPDRDRLRSFMRELCCLVKLGT